MAEKFRYGPLVYNCFGDEDDSGNYWWNGPPVVGYEQAEGIWKIPIDENGNQCLPGDCILHPNCRVQEWDEKTLTYPITFRKNKKVIQKTQTFSASIPNLDWCKQWFEDNYLIIDDYTVCKYIVRWMWLNNEYKTFLEDNRKQIVIEAMQEKDINKVSLDISNNTLIERLISELWPDVTTS